MNNKYVLCFKGKDKNGKEEVIKIYESSLKNIDMYTCYNGCYSANDLYNLFPLEVKNYISSFKKYDFKNNFFIRKSCKNIKRGKTDLEVLFKSDSDIVYSKEEDILNTLLKMKINDKNTDEEKNIKKEFFNKLYEILLRYDNKLLYKIDSILESSGTFFPNRIVAISRMSSCLAKIAKEVSKDYVLKRKVVVLLKHYKKKIDDIYNVKTRLVDETELDYRIKNRKFSYHNAKINMLNNINVENKYESKDLEKTKLNEKETKFNNKLENNPDYINYIVLMEEKNKKEVNDDFEDDNYDDFLGPKEPNDHRYWSIN